MPRDFWSTELVLEIGDGNLRLHRADRAGPASRVLPADRLLTATTKISMCPHMTSYSTSLSVLWLFLSLTAANQPSSAILTSGKEVTAPKGRGARVVYNVQLD